MTRAEREKVEAALDMLILIEREAQMTAKSAEMAQRDLCSLLNAMEAEGGEEQPQWIGDYERIPAGGGWLCEVRHGQHSGEARWRHRDYRYSSNYIGGVFVPMYLCAAHGPDVDWTPASEEPTLDLRCVGVTP